MEKMKNWVNLLKKDQRGLTLVELLAVVVILAIVALIAFVSIGNVIENSRKDAHIANAQQVIAAAELEQASTGDVPTGTLSEDLLNTIAGELVNPWKNDDTDYAGLFTIGVDSNDNITIATAANADTKCHFSAATKVELAEKGRDICE